MIILPKGIAKAARRNKCRLAGFCFSEGCSYHCQWCQGYTEMCAQWCISCYLPHCWGSSSVNTRRIMKR